MSHSNPPARAVDRFKRYGPVVLSALFLAPGPGTSQPAAAYSARLTALEDSVRAFSTPERRAAWIPELERIGTAAETAGDRRAALTGLLLLADVHNDQSDQPARRAALDHALELAKALEDGEKECYILNEMALAAEPERQIEVAERLREAALRIGSKRWHASADAREASAIIFAGGMTRADSLLREAGPVLEEEGAFSEASLVLQYTAIAATESGRPAEARRLFEAAIARARQGGDHEVLFTSLGNAAAFEMRESYDERALRYFACMDSIARRTGNLRHAVRLKERVAHALIRLHRLNEAVAVADSGVALADSLGLGDWVNACNLASGWALSNLGSYAESNRRLRSVLAHPEESRVSALMSCAATLADNLMLMDSLSAGLAVVRAYLPMADANSVDRATYLRLRAGDILLDMGRPAAGDSAYAQALARIEALPFHIFRSELQTGRALAAAARGDAPAARAHVAAAARSWREMRRRAGLNAMRERLSTMGSEIAGAAIVAASPGEADAGDVAVVFDEVEHYKARNLIERLTGEPSDTAGASYAGTTVAALQSEVLEPGELLLDFRLWRRGSGVFAITRESIRWLPIPVRGADLSQRVREWRRLIMEQKAASPRTEAATRALADLLLGGVREEVRAAHTVIVAPERSLHLVPFALLVEAVGGDEGAAPRSIAAVPSASVLATRRNARPAGSVDAIVAAAGRVDDLPGAAILAGARDEVAWLDRRFEDVATLGEGGRDTLDWTRADVIHLAAHMRSDEGSPWNSAVRIALDGPDGAPSLRAERVARMHLSARLVVLASCASVGESVIVGEGVNGMATAFIVAGAPTVVATLWPVDDRATARFTRHFYEALEDGQTVGAAVRDAQRRLSRDRQWRAPVHWAGYVVVGDPATRVTLRGRPRGFTGWLTIPILMLVVVTLLLVRRRARRGGPA